MRFALRVLVNIQKAYRFNAVAKNVRAEDHVVADCLSSGQYLRAKEHAEKDGEVTRGTNQGYMEEWERYLVEEQKNNTRKEIVKYLFL